MTNSKTKMKIGDNSFTAVDISFGDMMQIVIFIHFAVFDVSYNAVNWFDKLLLTFMVRA